MKVYHDTSVKHASEILANGFQLFKKEVTNDLGIGIYTYCDDENHLWNTARNAQRFADQYKNGPTIVLSISLLDTATYIDFDYLKFLRKWELLRSKLKIRANNKWKSFSRGHAKRRHNLEGIIFEEAIRHKMLYDNKGHHQVPDFLVKRTYTSFIPQTISNFYNGRELVIRNLSIINYVKKVEKLK